MKTTILKDERVLELIRKLHDDKMEINRVKLEHYGRYDTDDHGFLYDPDFEYHYESNSGDGVVPGPVEIGKALLGYMNAIPAYINPSSALAGAWYGAIRNFVRVGLAPGLVPEELEKV